MIFAQCLALFIPFVSLSVNALGQNGDYAISDTITGEAFYTRFDWETMDDPTHGRVNYVDEKTSRQQNLTYASDDTFILRADHKSVVKSTARGRNSVRIISKKTYTTHVAIFDVRHMPQGCGTWPAIWETQGDDWPTGGEIDIVEGANDQGPNAATLHTTPGCSMPFYQRGTGAPGQLDCNWQVNSNTGCGVRFGGGMSYGPNFNANRGGWFALERTNDHISVWFWPRNATVIPNEIEDVNGDTFTLSTTKWGTPAAYFPNTDCNMKKYFGEHNIIINLTLCGDWAGSTYSQTKCPSSCVDFVNNNPSSFSKAYFDIGSIRIYEPRS
ncbi:2 beta-glucanase [Pholiota conissans]|uniref:2 beta-glucanase n=1 Tax=Pholiota conissans TaxID=109636 RepID=A0A9P6CQY6_9AGAR|nr:2 beta-glucanase [Pholiota conissans]